MQCTAAPRLSWHARVEGSVRRTSISLRSQCLVDNETQQPNSIRNSTSRLCLSDLVGSDAHPSGHTHRQRSVLARALSEDVAAQGGHVTATRSPNVVQEETQGQDSGMRQQRSMPTAEHNPGAAIVRSRVLETAVTTHSARGAMTASGPSMHLVTRMLEPRVAEIAALIADNLVGGCNCRWSALKATSEALLTNR